MVLGFTAAEVGVGLAAMGMIVGGITYVLRFEGQIQHLQDTKQEILTPTEGFGKIIQETHDSTLRQEGMIKSLPCNGRNWNQDQCKEEK
jgi:hypothetical protein